MKRALVMQDWAPPGKPLRSARAAAARLAVALAVALVAGCTGNLLQSDAPVPDTFRLTSAPPAAAAGVAPLPLAVVVQRPRATAALDTDRIAISAAGNRFDYYSAALWAEPAPQMVQQQLVNALAATGQFGGGVFAAPARVPNELLLDVELRRFEAVTSGANAAASDTAPVVHVQVQASLIDSRRGARVTSFVAEAAVPATENRLSAVIAAFERANAQVMSEVSAKIQAAVVALPKQ
jgi:cholesterol transport system auxiliary component